MSSALYKWTYFVSSWDGKDLLSWLEKCFVAHQFYFCFFITVLIFHLNHNAPGYDLIATIGLQLLANGPITVKHDLCEY